MFGERELNFEEMSKIVGDFILEYGHLLKDEKVQGITMGENDRNKSVIFISATKGYELPEALPERFQGIAISLLEVREARLC